MKTIRLRSEVTKPAASFSPFNRKTILPRAVVLTAPAKYHPFSWASGKQKTSTYQFGSFLSFLSSRSQKIADRSIFCERNVRCPSGLSPHQGSPRWMPIEKGSACEFRIYQMEIFLPLASLILAQLQNCQIPNPSSEK